jgi:drug/metabolite transporter (DMT)-like permease
VIRALPFVFVLLWSGAFVAVRAGLADITPLFFLAVRFGLAAAVLALIAVALTAVGRKQNWAPLRERWFHFVIAGCLINSLYLSAGYLALTKISAATLALVGALNPLLTALASIPLLGDRFRPVQWLGFGLGTLGVVLVVGVDLAQPGLAAGVGWALVAVLPLVAGTLYYSRFCKGVDLVPANLVQLGSSALLCALLTLMFEDVHAVWTPSALATLAYLAFAVSLGGMAIFLFLLKQGTAGKVAANFYLTPGTTALLGWAILGEALAPLAILGFVVASCGVRLVQREKQG